MPCLPLRTVPLDEHDTSYFADSASIRNFSIVFSVNITTANLHYFLQIGKYIREILYFCTRNSLNMAKEQSQIRERQRTNLKEPRRYKVIIYNDDFTTMEFVVMILVQVFLKSEEEANALMLQVHHSDKAVVGIYSYDIALSKARKATNMAREQGFPLRLTVEGCD